jgi:hypothetical protein
MPDLSPFGALPRLLHTFDSGYPMLYFVGYTSHTLCIVNSWIKYHPGTEPDFTIRCIVLYLTSNLPS